MRGWIASLPASPLEDDDEGDRVREEDRRDDGDAAYLKDVVARLDRFLAGQKPFVTTS